LQVERRKSRQIHTTYSNHQYCVAPNLLRQAAAKAPGQILVADLTYLSLQNKQHMFLFLITDTVSRMVLGYSLRDDQSHEGALEALDMALKNHGSSLEGAIHHSDRGTQYCCHHFQDEARLLGIHLSHTDADHCAQNALAESINGLLKSEFLLDAVFPSPEVAHALVNDAIFKYNHIRIHGSLNQKTPAEVHFGRDDTLDNWLLQIAKENNFSLEMSVNTI
jgi:transposase InsO family protein